MLENLHVKNIALIEEAEVDFGPGLNILTGETGAGKSIIIGSIGLALGEKVPKELLREEGDSLVELTFSVDEETGKALRDIEIEPEDGKVLLTRKAAKGRTIARINGETVTAGKLKEAAGLLIDIHGQHEHQSLLKTHTHLEILDRYLGDAFLSEKEAYREAFLRYKKCREELQAASLGEEERKRELSLLEYEIREITEARLREGEDEELEKAYRKLVNGKKICEALGQVVALISEGEGNASEAVGRSCRELSAVAEYDEKLEELQKELTEIDGLLSDFAHEAAGYLSDAEFDGERFRETEDRLSEINRLKDKYGDTVSGILRSLSDRQDRFELLSDLAGHRQRLEAALSEAKERAEEMAQHLSEKRQNGARKLCGEIRQALTELNFLDVRFSMEFEEGELGPEGKDHPQFLISVNPGEKELPLGKAASGGELSRVMLAIKTVLAEEDEIGTLIFDEIDTGISGRTAQAVSEKLGAIGRSRQIICITHLPQIAAMADTHFVIEKTAGENTAETEIRELSEEESIKELSRLLGGARMTEAVYENAREMKQFAKGKQNT